MKFTMTNNIALGVRDMDKAAAFYESVLGFKRGKESGGWIELISGPLNLYVCPDEVSEPVFEMTVEDVEAAKTYLAEAGCSQVVYDEDDKELFMCDPFGYVFCISPAETSDPLQ